MFQLDTTNPRIIYRRQTGRLMRPSDRIMRINGLGEVDGILDTLKNLGSGIVQSATLGIYDPRKNRFYVPFSSGNVRNFLQGTVSASTLGLVKSDKFFGSQSVRTAGTVIGAVGAAVGAGALTYYGGSALVNKFGSTSVPGAVGSPVFGPQAAQVATSSTSSLIPSLDTVSKTLSIASKFAGAGGGGGAQLPQPMEGGGGQPGVVIINQPAGELPSGPGMIPNQAFGYGYDPLANYSGLLPSGGGVIYSGGGGGGVGPPGSEYEGQPMIMNEQGVLEPAGIPMGTKIALVAGVGILGYFLFVK